MGERCPECGGPMSSSVEDYYCAELCGWSQTRASSEEFIVCDKYDPNRPVGVLKLNAEAAQQLRRKALIPAVMLPEGEVLMLGLIDRAKVDTAPDLEFDGS